ncbi:MAG: plasmid recombination protein [Clostridia bacterium]|nr:plasmid recombination protein [Clostridia bacterium]
MTEVSVTVTVGEGSESHNHDLEYRRTLTHVHEMDDGVIELVPYTVCYRDQINALLKPYIDEYNERVDQRYQEAWDRYNAGEIKTKPRKRDYKHMDYDYCAAHEDDYITNPVTGKREKIPLFRSLIIGFGDKQDREQGRITEDQAKTVSADVVRLFQEKFPHLKVLGATLHLDEQGFFHLHLDYKPVMAAEFSKGLQCTVSQELVLEQMGYQPEQSIINGRDKAPLRFNAFRNEIYRYTEECLAAVGLRLMYGASKVKEPEKDSSVNQPLANWQATQDAANELQHLKNVMLDTVQGDHVSPEGFKKAVAAADKIGGVLDEIEKQPRSRLNKNNVVVNFHLFDQLRSFVKDMVETVRHLLQRIDILTKKVDAEKDKVSGLQAKLRGRDETIQQRDNTIERYKDENSKLDREARQNRRAARENAARQQFMERYRVGDMSLEEKFQQEQRQRQQSLDR